MTQLTSKEEAIRAKLTYLGQDHVWAHYMSLDARARAPFIDELDALDVDSLKRAIHICQSSELSGADMSSLEAPSYIPSLQSGGDAQVWEEARLLGESLLSSGKVAVLTVAGGQGTRLGFPGPKGCFGVTPICKKSLFQVFAEKILAAQRRYRSRFYWLIMTSQVNGQETKAFFDSNHLFGLDEDQVIFFEQGLFPSVDFEGKLIIEAPGHLAMSPDGHGGVFDALVKSKCLDHVCAQGVEILSYFQVDNPLVRILDPVFIGFHRKQGSSMSSKMVVKEDPSEKVGLFCLQGDVLSVVEYSDIPESLANKRDASGQLMLRAGNIAVHLIDGSLVSHIAEQQALPFHCAKKVIPYLGSDGVTVRPERPNGTKFEKFVFDGLQFAKTPLLLEVPREDEFSPVKNAGGADSPHSSMEDQSRIFARWLEAAGAEIPRDKAGNLLYRLEISPLFADDLGTFLRRWEQLDPKPSINEDLYLE